MCFISMFSPKYTLKYIFFNDGQHKSYKFRHVHDNQESGNVISPHAVTKTNIDVPKYKI